MPCNQSTTTTTTNNSNICSLAIFSLQFSSYHRTPFIYRCRCAINSIANGSLIANNFFFSLSLSLFLFLYNNNHRALRNKRKEMKEEFFSLSLSLCQTLSRSIQRYIIFNYFQHQQRRRKREKV